MFYVYYDKEKRTITAITNEKNSSDLPFVIKEKQDVEDFILGNRNTNDYVLDKDLNLVQLVRHQETFDVNHNFHLVENAHDPDIKILHKNCWKFQQCNDVTGTLYFVVTEKNNPNNLIRTIYFSAQELDKDIEFQYPIEQHIENVSIWTIYKTFTVALENQ